MEPSSGEDRRKTLRRREDVERTAEMKDIKQRLKMLERANQDRKAEFNTLNKRMDERHSENTKRLDGIVGINETQLDLLQNLVTARNVSVWAGHAIKWIIGLAAAGIASFEGWRALKL